jgi:hypothetical protein
VAKRSPLTITVVGALLVVGFLPKTTLAIYIGQAVQAIADQLVAEQIPEGVRTGTWPKEATFTRSIITGVVGAYEPTFQSAYKASVKLVGDYVLLFAQENFFCDETFALTHLSQIAADPRDNAWLTAVSTFYSSIETDHHDNIQGYIGRFVWTEPSTDVFYSASHVVATYFVDAIDKEMQRLGLIIRLTQGANASQYPVMAMGIAMRALVRKDLLNDTFIPSSGEDAPYLNGKKPFEDQPDLLSGHQVAEGRLGAGSIYWQSHHGEGDLNNCTEAANSPLLGWLPPRRGNSALNLDCAILAAHDASLGSVSYQGMVLERLSREDKDFYEYAREILNM